MLQEDVWQGARGDLGNIIGNPLESTAFVSRLIYDGTLDKFPRLKICVAHAGGYLSSYLGRGDLACEVRGNANCANTRQFREYFTDQIMVDTMIFPMRACGIWWPKWVPGRSCTAQTWRSIGRPA